MEPIRNAVAITPVWNESLAMIQKFQEGVEKVRHKLTESGIGFRHFFLDDCALHLPDEYPILVRHTENQGLAKTLLDGYEATLGVKSAPDLVVRLDANEHDPLKIVEAVDHLSHAPADALFLPVWYWVESDPRPLMQQITAMIADFTRALSPINAPIVVSIYNQKFPMGFAAFRPELLRGILPLMHEGLKMSQEISGKPVTWGLDLLKILLAAEKAPGRIDFLFGGWAQPWAENRGPDKIAAQRKRAETMVDVAGRLGCKML